jgi:predicted DNA-binding transcriptional regulator AlpA
MKQQTRAGDDRDRVAGGANELPAAAATAALTGLAAVGALIAGNLRPAAGEPTPGRPGEAPADGFALAAWSQDDLLTVSEAAAALRLSPRWLYRHAKTLPFARKLSRKVLRFSRAGIARWLATKRP